jgi:hypothetical protein
VGPNRLYVMLARSLAAMGSPCLRFDLEGIGDSVLRGDVNFRRLVEAVSAQVVSKATSSYHALCETLAPAAAPRLSKDLGRLFARGRRVTMFVAESDPGVDVLMAGTKRTATKALRNGLIRLHRIAGADHTFSQAQRRRDFLRRLTAHVRLQRPA